METTFIFLHDADMDFETAKYAADRASLLPSFAGATAIHPGPSNVLTPSLPGLAEGEVLALPDDEMKAGSIRKVRTECRSALMAG